MVIRNANAADAKAECYPIRDANVYVDDNDQQPVPLLEMWLIWFGSLPLLAAIVYMLIQVFGS